jgi:hypothetical protein
MLHTADMSHYLKQLHSYSIIKYFRDLIVILTNITQTGFRGSLADVEYIPTEKNIMCFQ